MVRGDRVFVTTCSGLVAFAMAYLWQPPGPRYYPLLHRWAFQELRGQIGMGLYWRAGCGLFAGLAAAALLGWLTRPAAGTPQRLSQRWTTALTGLVCFALLVLIARVVITEFGHWGTWRALFGA